MGSYSIFSHSILKTKIMEKEKLLEEDKSRLDDLHKEKHDRRAYEREHYKQTMLDAEKRKQQMISEGIIEINKNR